MEDKAEHKDVDVPSEAAEKRKKPVKHFRRGQLRRKAKKRLEAEAAECAAKLSTEAVLERVPEISLERPPKSGPKRAGLGRSASTTPS